MSLLSALGSWPFGNLLPLSFDLIMIDPPWAFETYSEEGQAKGPGAQYETMALEEIGALPVGHLARGDCLCCLWGTIPLIDRQIAIMKQWGFTYKSAAMWHKVHPSGKTAMGTGYRVRSMVEPVLIGTIGNPKHKAFPGLFTGIRRDHSRKPESFFDLIDKCCPRLQARADLFSRQTRPGWVNWGNESTKFDEVAA